MTAATSAPPNLPPRSMSTAPDPTVADIDEDVSSPSPSKSLHFNPTQGLSSGTKGPTVTSSDTKTNGHAPTTLANLLNHNPPSTKTPATPAINNLINSPQHHTHKLGTAQTPHHPTHAATPTHAKAQAEYRSPGVVMTTVGGRTRLTKRTPNKATLFPDEEDDAMNGGAGQGYTSRQGTQTRGDLQSHTHALQGQARPHDSVEEVDETMDERTDELDLTKPVDKFDSKTELVAHWNQLQDELWPYLKKWGEDRISSAELSVRRVFYEIHQMTVGIRDELEKGVKDIEEQEQQHERARKMILDFQNALRLAGAQMGDFGPASADRRAGN